MTKTRLYTPEAVRFSGTWWGNVVRSALFVGIVSVLIWTYADMTVSEDRSFDATLVLSTGNSENLVLLSESRIPVTFKLSATRKQLSDFERALAENHQRIHCDLSRGYAPGEHELIMEDLLNGAESPSFEGLAVLGVSPTGETIRLDGRVRKTARVELDFVGATLTEAAKIEPSEVIVSIAQSDLQTLLDRPNNDEGLTIKTRRLDLRNDPTGEPVTHEVELIAPPNARGMVTLEPTSVTVIVTTSQRTDQKTLTVAVQALGPSAWAEAGGTWDEYQLVKKDPLEWRPQIVVQGAKTDLEKLRPEDLNAHVVLTEDDKTPVQSWLSRPANVRFAPDLELELVGEAPVVHFRLEARTTPTPVITP